MLNMQKAPPTPALDALLERATVGPWRQGDAGVTVFGAHQGEPSPVTVATMTRGRRDNARLICIAENNLRRFVRLAQYAVDNAPHREVRDAARQMLANIEKEVGRPYGDETAS